MYLDNPLYSGTVLLVAGLLCTIPRKRRLWKWAHSYCRGMMSSTQTRPLYKGEWGWTSLPLYLHLSCDLSLCNQSLWLYSWTGDSIDQRDEARLANFPYLKEAFQTHVMSFPTPFNSWCVCVAFLRIYKRNILFLLNHTFLYLIITHLNMIRLKISDRMISSWCKRLSRRTRQLRHSRRWLPCWS